MDVGAVARNRLRARLRRVEALPPVVLGSDQAGLARTVLDLVALVHEMDARLAALEVPAGRGDATEPGAGPPLPMLEPEQEQEA